VNDDRIDGLLREDASRWQSAQQTLFDVDPEWFGERDQLKVPPLLSAGLVIVLVAAVVYIAWPRPDVPEVGVGPTPTATAVSDESPLITSSPSTEPSPTTPPAADAPTADPDPAIVVVGEAVTISGHLIELADEDPFVCPVLISAGSIPGCEGAPPNVHVAGVDVRELPGALHAGTWVTDYFRIDGTWNGEEIEAIELTPAEAPSDVVTLPPAPCGPPTGGWPGTRENAEQELDRLAAVLLGDPDLYAGSWWSSLNGNREDGMSRALVVNTTGDPEDVSARLSDVYHSNLCVLAVDFSNNDLQKALDRFERTGGPWTAEIDTTLNRLKGRTVVFDQELADAIAPFGEYVVVDALVSPNPDVR